MKFQPVRFLIQIFSCLTISLLLAGCASGPPPQVVDTAQANQPSAQSLEMIQALSQLNNLEEELKLLRNSVEEMQFQLENGDRRQQDLYQDIDRRLLALEEARTEAESRIESERPLSPSEQVLAEGRVGQGGLTVDDPDPDAVEGGDVDSPIAGNLPSRNAAGSSSVSLTEQQAYDSAFARESNTPSM